MERAGNLFVRRRVWRNGPPLAWNDPRLWRSRIVRTIQMAIHHRASISARGLRRVLFLGHKDESGCDDRLLVGRLAWHDADLRVRPNLRCKDRLVRSVDAAFGLR